MEQKKLRFFSRYSTHEDEIIRDGINGAINDAEEMPSYLTVKEVWIVTMNALNSVVTQYMKVNLPSALSTYSKMIVELVSLFPSGIIEETSKNEETPKNN